MLDCVDAMSRFWNLLLIINASWYPEPIAKCQNGKGERIHTKVRRCGLRRSSSPLGSKVEAIFVDAAFAFVLFISFVVCLCSLCRSNYRAFGVSFPLHYNAGARCKFVNFRIYIHWPCLDQKIILIKKLGLFIKKNKIWLVDYNSVANACVRPLVIWKLYAFVPSKY